MKNKKAIEISMLLYLLIAVLVLAVGVLVYFYITKSGEGLLASIKDFLRFGAG